LQLIKINAKGGFEHIKPNSGQIYLMPFYFSLSPTFHSTVKKRPLKNKTLKVITNNDSLSFRNPEGLFFTLAVH